ncbi:MAG: hypothetical protein QW840_03655, partial [Candidatus Bathyarchaeia archaeon]
MGAQELLMDKVFQVLRKTRLLRTLQIRSSPKPFTEYFKGFEKIEAVKRIFGNETEKVLQNLKVEFTFIKGYMWVNDR